MLFDLQIRERGGWAIVGVVGELDLATAPSVRRAVLQAVAGEAGPADRDPEHQPVSLVLDLSGVDFIDSSGLGVVLGAVRRVRATGGLVRIVIAAEQVRRVFEVTRLDEIFDIDASVDEAVSHGPVIGLTDG